MNCWLGSCLIHFGGCRSSRNAGGKPTIAFVRAVGRAMGRQPKRPSRRDPVDSHGGGTTIGGSSPAHNVVAQGILQTSWVSPKFTIDCVLANVSTQLEADGCVLERVEAGSRLTTPGHLRAGDTVNVQLWLEGDEACIDIPLAEVTRVYEHWVAVEVITLSPSDRTRLKRFIDAPPAIQIEEPASIDHLLIRA